MDLSYYELYAKQYKKFIPPFYKNQIKKVDVYPIISFLRIYEHSDKIQKFKQRIYLDIDTGWITVLVDPRAFYRSQYFYVGFFPNRRPAKRIIFGLRGKEVLTCAIMTHVSAKIEDQRHVFTKQALQRAKIVMRKMPPVIDIRKLDLFVFKTHPFSNIRRFFPRWYYYYAAAFKLKLFWKGQ